jgi:hypothetical protein
MRRGFGLASMSFVCPLAMIFDPKIVEARIALNDILSTEMPSFACDALEAGFDGPNIRRLASLVQPSGFEVDQLLRPVMSEMNLKDIPRDLAYARLAQSLARQVLSQGEDPLKFTGKLERLWMAAGYPSVLGDIGMIDEDVWCDRYAGKNDAEIRAWVTERLEAVSTANIEPD